MRNNIGPAVLHNFFQTTDALITTKARHYFSASAVLSSANPSSIAFPYEREVLLLLSNHDGSIELKIHFEIEAAVLLAAKAFGIHREQISDDDALDYFREWANSLGGALRGSFDNARLPMTRMIPFIQMGSVPGPSERILEIAIDDLAVAVSISVGPEASANFEQALVRVSGPSGHEAESAGEGEVEFL